MIKLMPHQKEVFDTLKNYPNAGVFLDMGLGKTFIGSELAKYYDLKTLCICQKSKVDDWIEHFNTYYQVKVYNLLDRDELKNFIVDDSICVGVINYDLVFRRDELKKLKNFTMLLDESSSIQNENAKRSKFIKSLKSEHNILLSGTVINGKYEKLYSQVKLLGWDISKAQFYNEFICMVKIYVNGFMQSVPSGKYKRVPRLKAKLREHGAIFMKTDDVISLPKQNFIDIKVPVSKEYKTFEKHNIVDLDKIVLIGDMKITARMRLKQLCGAYNTDKVNALVDLIESTDDRVIIFYQFKHDFEHLRNVIHILGRPISYVNGDGRDLSAYEACDDAIVFVQWQSGALGLNLQKANKMIMFTPPDGWAEGYNQALKRIHRIGQEKPCFYWRLIVSDSIEEDIYKNIEHKSTITDNLFKG